jgi:hypothetical protein
MGYIGNQPYLGTVTGDIVVDGSITAQDLAPGAAVPSQTGNAGKYLTTDGTNASWGALSQVRVTAIDYPGDDTATLPAGGATLTLTGTGFAATPMVFVDGTLAPSVSFVSSTQITFVAPAKSAGTYHLYVVNPDGATAIFVNGISYSGVPTWTTASGSLGAFDATFSIQLVATSDSAVTYALTTGSTLPAGITLSSGGLISGTNNTEQTFSFSVDAIDAQNQETPRSFSVTIVLAEPYFNRNVLLLSGDGANNQTNNTFLDSSANNFTITRNGNTTQGTFSPFSQTGWGNYFDGATATRLTMPSNTAFAFGTGAYTVEAWVYLSAHAATQTTVVDCGSNTGSLNFSVLSTGALSLGVFGVGPTLSSAGGAVALNTWNHVAVVRESTASNATKLYVNGTAVATGTDAGNYTVTTTPSIGGLNSSGLTATGYISNVRLVKGTAVYTSNFTPSTTPLTAISGTSLLTCQNNRFIDNSTNAFAITRNGDVSVQAFSPFNPTAAWSASTNGGIGGSGYFDGSGDYLDIAHNAVLTPAGDFTIEFWAYPLTASGIREWYTKGIGIQFYSNGAAWGLALSSNNSGTYYINATFGTLIANAWQHVVVTRSGNSYVGFVNGVATSLGTTSSAPGTGTDALRIGDLSVSGGYPVFGYMSGVRYVNGTAVYGTSNFTPPTSPPTAVANTQLLTNFTNAGIYDATSKNDLETVGNAQISTTQSKFGGSSMYFDGTNDGLIGPSTQLASFGTGDFTVESWVYLTTISGADRYLFTTGNGIDTSLRLYIGSTGEVVVYTSFGIRLSSTNPLVVNTWTHVAVRRYNGTLAVYLNGVQNGTASYSTAIDCNGKISVGSDNNGGSSMIGYLDDFRVTKGIARYTSNFTPPTTAHKLR